MIFTGDLRDNMARELRGNLERIINQRAKGPSFYVLAHVKWTEMNEITTKLVILSEFQFRNLKIMFGGRDPRLLSTLCWFVDTDECKLIRKWSLPADIPILGVELMDGPKRVVEETIEEAVEAPVYH